MTERDRLTALLLCSAIRETARKVQTDFAAMQKAAEDFADSIKKMVGDR